MLFRVYPILFFVVVFSCTSSVFSLNCPTDGSWPETEDGNTASLPCADGTIGVLYRECPPDSDTWANVVGSCEPDPACPVDCISGFTEWSDCYHVSEGRGLQTRYRLVSTFNRCGGVSCPDLTYDSRACEVPECDVNVVDISETFNIVASSGNSGHEGRSEEVAIDHDLDTWWQSAGPRNQYIVFDAIVERVITRISIIPKERKAKNVLLQTGPSSNGPWKTEATVEIPEDNPFDNWAEVFSGALQSRFFRIFIESGYSKASIGIVEIAIDAYDYNFCWVNLYPDLPTEPTCTPTANGPIDSSVVVVTEVSSREEFKHGGDKAFDGNLGTDWRSTKPTNQWISWDMGTVYALVTLTLKKQSNRVEEVFVDIWTNDAWEKVEGEAIGFEPSSVVTFDGDEATSRYYRLTVKRSYGGGRWIRIREIELVGRVVCV